MSAVPYRTTLPPRLLPVPGRYRHFKGGEYELLSVGRHTETDELFVVYHTVNDPKTIWIRPLEMFTELIERPEGTVRRFELCEPAHAA